MPDLPNTSGQQPTGRVSGSGSAEMAITEPKHRLQSAFSDMIVSGFTGAPEEYKQNMRNMNNAIVSANQQRWWKAQDETFTQGAGASYKNSSDQLQAGYMDELGRAADVTDPHDRMTAMNAAHGRMWSELSRLDQQFFEAASKYSTNPIINNRVSFVMQKRQEMMSKISGGGQQAAEQVRTEEQAGLVSAQAGAARAETGGFYSATRGQAAVDIPEGSARDFIITQAGGREELVAETDKLANDMSAVVPQAFAEYQQAKNTGHKELIRDARKMFRETFFIDPEDLGTKEGDALLGYWQANEKVVQGLDDRAARIVFDRLLAAGRGFQSGPGTTSPEAPGATEQQVADVQRTSGLEARPQIGAPPTGQEQKAGQSLIDRGASSQIAAPSGSSPQVKAQYDLAQQMGPAPDFNVERAVQAMGGNTPEESELAGRRAYDAVRRQFESQGISPPKDWNPEPSVEVTEFAQRLYASLPSMGEEKERRGKRRAKSGITEQKYLDGLSDKILKIFSSDYDKKLAPGLDRDDAIWFNLLFLHQGFLEKHPKSTMSVEQMITGALANLGERSKREKTRKKIGIRN